MTSMEELDLWAREMEENEPCRCSFLFNIANFLFFLANAVVTIGVGLIGVFGLQTIQQVSDKYTSLVTVPPWTHYTVCVVVLLSQFVWAVTQLRKKFRRHFLLSPGVTYWYAGYCISIIAWTLLLGFDMTFESIFASAGVLMCPSQVLSVQDKLGEHQERTREDYWLMRCGFLTTAAASLGILFYTLSTVIVAAGVDPPTQYWVALLSIALIGLSSVWVVMLDTLFSLILAFITFGIFVELLNPSPVIQESFEQWRINNVMIAALVVCSLTVLLVALRAWCHCRYLKRRQRTTHDESTAGMRELPR